MSGRATNDLARSRQWIFALAPMLVVAALVLIPVLADARPGGGQTYGGGGGGSSGGGGGGSGDGELFGLLLWIALEHPAIGVPLLLIAGVVYVVSKRGAGQDWDSGGGLGFDPGPRQRAPQAKLADLRQVDPDFSTILFEDFVYRLYASAHEARGAPAKLAELAPYLEQRVRDGLVQRQPSGVPISNVVVGAMRVLRVQLPSWDQAADDGSPHGQRRNPATDEPESEVELEFEANVTAGGAGSPAQGFYLWERWVLRRPISVTTPDPQRARSLACPNCGAPFRTADMQRCEYCQEVVTDGRFDWRVIAIQELRAQPKPPALTSEIGEAGTNLPTIYDPHLHQAWTSLATADPALVPGAIEQRVQLIYRELNTAWTARDLRSARGFLSDGMADYLRYWVEAYKREGLINKLEQMRVTGIQLVKITRDRWYDAATFRVFATGRDYTVRDTDGQHVSGNPRRDRAYSEYWTLIRGTGVQGAPRDDRGCPNCGAPLAISMGGTCEHCSAHVSSGEFDWVLSKIEQDEVYGG
ncbi:putative membrane protein [Enhygromyxa salina]|uniref:Putative membrane protein n=1 Tax=Enhygromyxa salina TaxID=215803 RepID=A0A0C1ZXP9_9BACT|nr:TIM44-like domain-containing protein [Enhygromyxa salina]KIG15978.1 putative membrane protein [Enhygromyxa salina]